MTGAGRGYTRREVVLGGLAAGAGIALGAPAQPGSAATSVVRRIDFAATSAGGGWGRGWRSVGVANLRVVGGLGLLEAGSDVFPNDPRPVAFAVDCRLLGGSVRAHIARIGSAAGVVLRRTSPRDYYAALYDVDRSLLTIVRRNGSELVTLAQTVTVGAAGTVTLELTAAGAAPTSLRATLTSVGGVVYRATATDGHGALQRPGDPGVLAQARTLFPSAGPPVVPALGNLHLLPYGVQEGQAFIETPVGQAVLNEIRRRSTVAFREIEISSTETVRPSAAAVVAATTGVPLHRGARLHVATDLPAEVSIEVSRTPGFERPRTLTRTTTGDFDGASLSARELRSGRRIYWRASARRRGITRRGPVRSFRALPFPLSPARVRIAVGSCGTQFGPIFDHLASREPDAFVWQGDLNYPDTHGPVAQTTSGYAGIWRDFLANPRLAPIIERSAFVAMRDDHDYGVQDAKASTIPDHPWALAPWDALMDDGLGYRFSAGLADVWVLDQRRRKSEPAAPDTRGKTLLGERQREWLLEGLAKSSAPFKVICSPCTVFFETNARDGNWGTGYTAERDLVLDHIARKVSGRTIFLTGDTHLTAVHDRNGRFEVRAAPIDIPVPNDITLTNPRAAAELRALPGVPYADELGHFAFLEVSGKGRTATLEVSLVRQDGTTPYRRRFEEPIPRARLRIAFRRGWRRSLRRLRRRRLRVRVSLNRIGRVRLRAKLVRVRVRSGRRAVVRLANRAVRIREPGRRRVALRLTRRGRAQLRRPGRIRLTLTGRYRAPGGRVTVRRIRRWLRR